MLPKPHRLPTPDIKQVMQRGRRLTSAELVLIYQENTIDTPRFAIVVPKRVDKRATARNRAKRLVREALRKLLPEMPGADGVFVVRNKFTSLKEAQRGIKGLALRIRVKDHNT